MVTHHKMIPRNAEQILNKLSKGYPVIAITGPRQSGKTTLAQYVFKDKPYVSFENPDIREFSENDPRGFLHRYKDGAIFDEIQHSPHLISYLQEIVDDRKMAGQFVLTGSQQFGIFSGITQSLAGRFGLVHLLPFSYFELSSQSPLNSNSKNLDDILFTGLYPPIHDRGLDPHLWYANYVQTYIERDVRQMVNIRDLSTFQRFLKLCAARVGQLLNLSNLATECGITHNTVKSWISLLEASYIIFLLQPHHANFSKRMIKTPKIYFYDTGLVNWFLSIQTPENLNTHALRGSIFECFVISEFAKHRFNKGLPANYFFWRDRAGNEVDLLLEQGPHLRPFEVKSGKTITPHYFKGLNRWLKIAKENAIRASIIYGGDETLTRNNIELFSWMDKKFLDQ